MYEGELAHGILPDKVQLMTQWGRFRATQLCELHFS